MQISHDIVFFDGYCNLCNGSVDFVIRRDQGRVFKFASLQGKTSQQMLPAELRVQLNTIVVLTKRGQIFTESRAIVYILGRLPYPAKALSLIRIFPTVLRNLVYRLIGKNRWIFGQRSTCRVPNEQERSLFLD